MRAPEVKAYADTLSVRIDNLVKAVDGLTAEHKETKQAFNNHCGDYKEQLASVRGELKTEFATLKKDVEFLATSRSVWGNRLFTAGLAVFCGVGGSLLTHYLKKLDEQRSVQAEPARR